MNINTRHIIIGDVHGCNRELQALINQLKLSIHDNLYFIGDLIDKGPDSIGVIQTVYKLSRKYKVKLILGNHEEKFLRFLKNKESNVNALQAMKNTEVFEQLDNLASKDEIDMLKNAYFYYKLPEHNYLLVHAGLPNDISLSLTDFPKYGKHFEKPFKKLRLLTMTRNLNKLGKFLSLGEESEGKYFWAEKYDGKYGTIVYGHEAYIGEGIKKYNNAIGIDTGCVYGGALTALVIEGVNEIYHLSQPSSNKKETYE